MGWEVGANSSENLMKAPDPVSRKRTFTLTHIQLWLQFQGVPGPQKSAILSQTRESPWGPRWGKRERVWKRRGRWKLCSAGWRGGEGAKRSGAEWSGKEAPTAEVQEAWAPPRGTFATME